MLQFFILLFIYVAVPTCAASPNSSAHRRTRVSSLASLCMFLKTLGSAGTQCSQSMTPTGTYWAKSKTRISCVWGVALVAEPRNYDSWSSFLRWQLFECIVDSVKGDRFARQPKELPAEEGLLTCNLQLSHHCWVQPQTPRSTKEICVFLCGWVGE